MMSRRTRGRRRVSDDIARQLQTQILGGEFKPGDRLPPERTLARMFGASRGSTREALRALEFGGFIEPRQGGSPFVVAAPPSAVAAPLAQFLERQRAMLVDLFEARRIIEPRLAFLAAERGTRAEIEAVRASIERQTTDLRDGDVEAASRADRQFHQAIADATHSRALSMLHNYLSDLVADTRRDATESLARREQALADHRRIFEALARGDGPAASAAMLEHLRNVESYFVEDMQAYRGAITNLSGPSGVELEVASQP